MSKNYTFDELVARKLQRDADREKVTELEVGGKSLKFRKPKEKEMFAIVDEVSGAEGTEAGMRALDKLIYTCCPFLQDEKLHTALDVTDPYSVPAAVFEFTERQKLGADLMEFCGLSDIEDEVKN